MDAGATNHGPEAVPFDRADAVAVVAGGGHGLGRRAKSRRLGVRRSVMVVSLGGWALWLMWALCFVAMPTATRLGGVLALMTTLLLCGSVFLSGRREA